jgi:hypothetical protein
MQGLLFIRVTAAETSDVSRSDMLRDGGLCHYEERLTSPAVSVLVRLYLRRDAIFVPSRVGHR